MIIHRNGDYNRGVVTLYLDGNGVYFHPLKDVVKGWQADLEEYLSDKPYPEGMIVETLLAGRQEDYFGDILIAHGFKRILETRNPNTYNKIVLFVRTPDNTK
jgi:hypothetical protein